MASHKGPVEVTWEDAAGNHGWKDRDEAEFWARGAFLVTTVGYIIKSTPQALTLAQSQTVKTSQAGDQLDHFLRIPRGMVKKVRRL